jgi:hypothetical protein
VAAVHQEQPRDLAAAGHLGVSVVSVVAESGRRTDADNVTLSFILLRYSAIFGTFTSLFFTSIQSTHCDLAVRIGSFAIAVSVASAGCIFSYRVFALWKGNKLVYGIIGLAYAIMLACWVRYSSKPCHPQ